MNTYFKYFEEYSDNEGFRFLELDEEFYCLRSILEEKDKLRSSNFVDSDFGDGLPDQSLEEALDQMTEITKTEFEDKWNECLEPFKSDWANLKSVLRVGEKVTAEIVIFYPQGTVLSIGQI
ncbi:MAG: hypothetical protein IAF38_08760, partial [Bacteroidia bacterium]|nr:hypothetical protein [Bacteroidia bacterium]